MATRETKKFPNKRKNSRKGEYIERHSIFLRVKKSRNRSNQNNLNTPKHREKKIANFFLRGDAGMEINVLIYMKNKNHERKEIKIIIATNLHNTKN
jgi:hypothetical protein